MAFVQVSDLPLTGSGKIDRMKLPLPSLGDRETSDLSSSTGSLKPVTPIEKRLAEIWASILNVDNIGTLDDFLDLGGTSMLAIQCVARIRKIFDVDIAVDSFFEHATIGQLAQTILQRTSRQSAPTPP
jgi:acyl carrier protein